MSWRGIPINAKASRTGRPSFGISRTIESKWWPETGSNRRREGPFHGRGHPHELRSMSAAQALSVYWKVVARDGIEPPTPAFSGPRSTTELSGLGMLPRERAPRAAKIARRARASQLRLPVGEGIAAHRTMQPSRTSTHSIATPPPKLQTPSPPAVFLVHAKHQKGP
jgi:hypothetical protein